jgi:nitrous oxide reductase accessory protein NosL
VIRRARAVVLVIALLAPGCARREGPPVIARGTPCATCGMDVRDVRFACERDVGGGYRVYDSIECLLSDKRAPSHGAVYLADYDQMALHSADSLWIVKGSFPTPMDGGLAAFLTRASAEDVAATSRGRVGRWTEFETPSLERAP